VKHQQQEQCQVSVILPVYNHERWVCEAIDSVVAQSYSDWELLIIDDASTDQSWAVLQNHLQNLLAIQPTLRIQSLHHAQNQGAPATINQGLQLATGDYLTVLNSDDVWDAARLARLLHIAQTQGYDFLTTDVAVLDADSQAKEAREPHWVAWFDGLKQDYANHRDMAASLLRGNFLITTSNFFFTRAVYQQVGGFADWRYVHDYDYALRVWLAGFAMQFLTDEKLLGYRLHECNTIREKPLAAIQENMQLLLTYLPRCADVLNPARLRGMQIQLQDLYRYTNEEWLTVVHQRLVAKEQELLPLLADRESWIAERDAWIVERDQCIDGLQQHVQQQHAWLADRESWIAQRDAWITERDHIIDGLQQHVQQQQVWLADRERWISERDAWIAERDQLLRQAQQQQQQLLNSRAFRLGESLLAPLRRFRQLFMGVGYA
jgi:glycosyltransferase involved in cell wall biosynthesis